MAQQARGAASPHANVAAGVARTEQARAPLLPQVKLEGLYERTTGNRAQKPDHTNTVGNSFDTFNWYDGRLTSTSCCGTSAQAPNRWRAAKAARGRARRHRAGDAPAGDADVRGRPTSGAARRRRWSAVARQTLANQAAPPRADPRLRPGRDATRDRSGAGDRRRRQRARAGDPAENDYAVARAELNQAMGTDGRHRLRRRRRHACRRSRARRARVGAAHRRGDPRPPRPRGAGRRRSAPRS